MIACPPPDSLERLLTDTLPDAERASIEEHVGRCPGCQALLDRLTSDPVADRWRALRAAGAAGANAPFLDRLAGLSAASIDPNQSTRADIRRATTPEGWDELPDVPGYEVLGVLGRGGMGVVYKARQVELDRVVAIKMLGSGAGSSAAGPARFRSEAEAVARLRHPNIVQIHEVGVSGGRPYYAMEYVEGGSLADALDGTPQPPDPAARMVEVLARAVEHAHGQGVVHRDLKPSNILLQRSEVRGQKSEVRGQKSEPAASSSDLRPLTSDLCPKITDFGLAKRLDQESGHTQTGAVLGTPSYMAPELAAGDAKAVGPATDVYGLGAILYELLTGRPPFRAATPIETMIQVRHDEPVPPRRFQPRLPGDLETVCLKCLEKEPAKRYPAAAAVADDLRRFLDGRPVLARPATPAERAWKWARRRPAAAGLVAVSAVAVLTLGVLVTGLVYNARLERSLEETRRAKALAEAYRYFHLIGMAHAEWRDHNVTQAGRYLDDCPPELRHWEWHYLQRLCRYSHVNVGVDGGAALAVSFSPDGFGVFAAGRDGAVRVRDVGGGRAASEFPLTAGGTTTAAFSADGTAVAAAGEDGTIHVRGLPDGRPLATAGTRGRVVHRVALSPDGRRLAWAWAGGQVWLWDVAAGRLLAPVLVTGAGGVTALAFSPDGSRLAAAGSGPDAIHVWDVPTGRSHPTLKGQYYPINGLAFSPDGARLASAGTDWTVRVWSIEAGRELLNLRGHTDEALTVAFSPDGARLASAGRDRAIRFWDAATGQSTLTLLGHHDGVESVAFGPGGALFVSADRGGAVKVWDVTTEQEARTVAAHADSANCVAFSPDGSRLVTAGSDRGVAILDVATGQTLTTLRGHSDQVWSVAHDPRGERVASIAADGELRLWDAATGQPLAAVPAHTGRGRCVTFSPDGTRVASTGWDGTVKLWDAASGQLVATLSGDPKGECVAFSPDGARLAAAGGDGRIRVWDAGSGSLALTLGGGDRVRGLAFRPDGRGLAVADTAGTVTVWDLTTGRPGLRLRDHTSAVFALAFTPDGARLASAGADGTVRLWDVESGQKLLTLAGHNREVFGLAFSPDGSRLASCGRTGAVRIWDARADSPAAAVEQTAVGLVADLFARPLCRDDVITILRATPALGTEVRGAALTLGGRHREESRPERYSQAARAALIRPGLSAERYRLALLQAEAAVRLAPLVPAYRIVLAGAQYRTGHNDDALATLKSVDRLVPEVPHYLALLALVHQRLGRPDLARSHLEQARKALEQPVWARRSDAGEARELCRQAADLLSGSTTNVGPRPEP